MYELLSRRAQHPAQSGGQLPNIRLATPADSAGVYQLIEEYYEAVDVVVRDGRETLDRYLDDAAGRIWVAYVGNVPAGCVVLRPLSKIDRAFEVKRMYVRPQFRRQGIAEMLMDALELHARASAIEWLYLDTKDDLLAAIRFYEQRGFQRCPRYNNNPQATIFMRKRVG